VRVFLTGTERRGRLEIMPRFCPLCFFGALTSNKMRYSSSSDFQCTTI
jgi:hypothetical protein